MSSASESKSVPRRLGWVRRWLFWPLALLLLVSLIANVVQYNSYRSYFTGTEPPRERFHSGDSSAESKIAVIKVTGTIMPPFTDRIIKAIERAGDDDDVKGILLVVDSPGGLVADSHQIYRALEKVRTETKKPIHVSMKRIAASGGYYISMGAGPEATIYAEPTTWTGSIGVIIPRYNAKQLAEKIGVSSEPLKTGEYKDALSPFRDLSEDERLVWNEIIQDAFDRFITVIDENRTELDRAEVESLATGQIYTADQALSHGLIDEIGYEEDALEAMRKELKLESARIVTYDTEPTLLELLSTSMEARQPEEEWSRWLDATTPRAMYYCSWGPPIPTE